MENLSVDHLNELFRKANQELEGPSPYLKTRVLAHLREERAGRRQFQWRWVAALGSAFSIALIAWMFAFSDTSFSARTGQPVLVKVELENIQSLEVAFAEIVLPEGVHFYSSQFPEMNDRRSLTLEWEPGFAAGKLPFVIQSDQAGSGEVMILLKDQNQVVKGQKRVLIQFES